MNAVIAEQRQSTRAGARILVIDDNPAIHDDFRKVLAPTGQPDSALEAASAGFLGRASAPVVHIHYEVDAVLRGEDGVQRVKEALEQKRPYALVFVDMRMPNGWNGLETTRRLWALCPDLQIVLCTAFSDYSWEEIRQQLGRSDRFLILKKPFDNIEVQQIADALSHRSETEAQLRLLDVSVGHINDIVMITDAGQGSPDGPRMVFVNDAFERRTGYSRAEALGYSPRMLQGPKTQRGELDRIRHAVAHGQAVRAELINYTRDGREFWVDLDIVPLPNAVGEVTHYVGIQRDITAQKEANAYIEHLAFYDSLTGLPNRRLFSDRLSQVVAACLRKPSYCALLFVDLDNFKELNDTFGHDLGDLLLIEVSARLRHCVREQDTLARMGGDEFILLLKDVGSSQEDARLNCQRIAEKISNLLDGGYLLFGTEHRSTASVGITLFGLDGARSDVLLKQADVAMYRAKTAGKNTFAFFDEGMLVRVEEQARMGQDLRAALGSDQLNLFFQPQIDAERGLIGAEALLRWNRPGKGSVPAGVFIGLAESTGLIKSMGGWAIDAACQELARWAANPALADLRLSVNVSAQQFTSPDFVDQVIASLARWSARPQRLMIELTETVVVEDVADVAAKIERLRHHGVAVALDDFGTGYSSLSYLRRLSIDELKIDQSFVRDVLTDASDATIARTIVALGQSLSLQVVAEGVETEAQRQYLLGIGCRVFQGYLFAKPMPRDEFEVFVRTHSVLPVAAS
jgi:diguanylate cyclase (GGDEF)-like protein/PAS domain S-box-containing protein